ncbi:hypothetical protein DPEC_G00082560 [Dallia pectoralis]|uniref:Uncharacterized protein n=1 Tax=Dallia pectoralis TaxID=75939 RepID=A0ACC2GYU0_DALPE|nr:hypothetical protein DPEC_G00082560 [Dallia pectoralis]
MASQRFGCRRLFPLSSGSERGGWGGGFVGDVIWGHDLFGAGTTSDRLTNRITDGIERLTVAWFHYGGVDQGSITTAGTTQQVLNYSVILHHKSSDMESKMKSSVLHRGPDPARPHSISDAAEDLPGFPGEE